MDNFIRLRNIKSSAVDSTIKNELRPFCRCKSLAQCKQRTLNTKKSNFVIFCPPQNRLDYGADLKIPDNNTNNLTRGGGGGGLAAVSGPEVL